MRHPVYSLSSAGGTGTITISFNLVDDSNPDSLFQNCTGGPNTGQDDDYWTHWLSKFESSVGGFKFRHLVSSTYIDNKLLNIYKVIHSIFFLNHRF
jgi:hypothetical protein